MFELRHFPSRIVPVEWWLTAGGKRQTRECRQNRLRPNLQVFVSLNAVQLASVREPSDHYKQRPLAGLENFEAAYASPAHRFPPTSFPPQPNHRQTVFGHL